MRLKMKKNPDCGQRSGFSLDSQGFYQNTPANCLTPTRPPFQVVKLVYHGGRVWWGWSDVDYIAAPRSGRPRRIRAPGRSRDVALIPLTRIHTPDLVRQKIGSAYVVPCLPSLLPRRLILATAPPRGRALYGVGRIENKNNPPPADSLHAERPRLVRSAGKPTPHPPEMLSARLAVG